MKAQQAATAPQDAAYTVRGQIDMVEPTGNVSGWCAATRAPFGPRLVSVLVDGAKALTGVACDAFRPDLLVAGVGDGRHGFSANLPAALIRQGKTYNVTLLDEATGTELGPVARGLWSPRAAPTAVLQSHVDSVRADGLLTGWVWDEAEPTRRVPLDIFADGVHAGTTVAGLFREDLRVAGKGSGHCGFSFFLPWALIAACAQLDVTLQDSRTGLPVGQSVTLRRPMLMNADRRIDMLESQLRLVRSELQAAEAQRSPAQDATNAADLFRTVAAFFQDMADGKPRPSLTSLRARLDEAAERLAPVPLSIARTAAATIFLLPDGRIDHLHASCAALHRAGADLTARITVLADSAVEADDTTLIHAVVRNLQTYRMRPDETINDALASAETPFLVLMPAQFTVAPDWLERLLALLTGDPASALATGAVAIGGEAPATQLLAADAMQGLLAHGGAAADAVNMLGLVLRTQSLRDAGWLDLSYSNLAAQILDLCVRLRAAGLRMAADADALAYCAGDATPLLDQASAEDTRRLQAACARLAARLPAVTKQPVTQALPTVHRTGRARHAKVDSGAMAFHQ